MGSNNNNAYILLPTLRIERNSKFSPVKSALLIRSKRLYPYGGEYGTFKAVFSEEKLKRSCR
jgi:hypothetical protein